MRHVSAWWVTGALVIALGLIWHSAAGTIPIPLPYAALGSLGLIALLLLWEHCEKLRDILGPRPQ